MRFLERAIPTRLVGLSTLLALLASGTGAQQPGAVLVGVVTDTAGAPVAGAEVAIVAQGAWAQTGEAGRFRLERLQSGSATLTVRRLGFEPRELEVIVSAWSPDTLTVRLEPNVHLLDGMEVAADTRRRAFVEEFHRRRARGIGYYVTREEIAARNAYRTSDVLRMAPGVRFVNARGGMGVRFVSSPIVRSDCMPMIWLDGQRVPGMEVDEIPVTDVEGIELYSGPATTPLQFAQSMSMTTCGTIVVWTRVPGT